jgi:hypothetical protein
MAESPQNEAARKLYEEEKKRSDKSKAASKEATKGKPTPTQEENDLTALGAHVMEKEDDGSGPDPGMTPPAEGKTRSMEGGGAAPYSTRQSAAKPAATRHES